MEQIVERINCMSHKEDRLPDKAASSSRRQALSALEERLVRSLLSSSLTSLSVTGTQCNAAAGALYSEYSISF